MAKIKKKQLRQQLAPGDEFRSIAETVADHYRRFAKQYNTVLTVAAIALLAGLFLNFMNADKERKAGRMLDAAYTSYDPAGGGTPDYQRALNGFTEVVKQYGGTMSGAIAQYDIGNALMGLGRYDDALKAYEAVIQKHGSRKALLGPVYTRMGYAYEALGKNEDAMSSFQKADETGGAGPATLELARLLERAGRTEEAQKRYRELSEKIPATTLALEARAKLPPPDLQQPPDKKDGKEKQ